MIWNAELSFYERSSLHWELSSPPMADLRWLTRVGHSKPGCWSHNVTTGIRASLVSVATRVTRQKVGQRKDVANEPNHHDGEDDLKGVWFVQMAWSRDTSPGFCCHYTYRKHFEYLHSGSGQALLPAVNWNRKWCLSQVLSKEHDEKDTPMYRERERERSVCLSINMQHSS